MLTPVSCDRQLLDQVVNPRTLHDDLPRTGSVEVDDDLAGRPLFDLDLCGDTAVGILQFQGPRTVGLVGELELDPLAALGAAVEAGDRGPVGRELDLPVVAGLLLRAALRGFAVPAGDRDRRPDPVPALARLAGDLVRAAGKVDVQVSRRARADVLDLGDDLVNSPSVSP
jgi:hypothetical protein